jgi:glycosyltransferase involved in cell wall biosynthesis
MAKRTTKRTSRKHPVDKPLLMTASHAPSVALSSPPQRGDKVLMIAHNHPDFFPGGGEILAYQLYQALQQTTKQPPIFLAATGALCRPAHTGTAFLAMEGRHGEYLFHNDSYDYLNHSNRQPEVLIREFADFLREHRPDIVHFHHILRVGVEALEVTRRTLPHARILLTLHDFLPMCHRDGQMVRTNNNELCHLATANRCHECFPKTSPAQFKLRELFIKTHLDAVDALISPSHFLRDRYIAWGIDPNKIHVIENGTAALTPALPRPSTLRNQFAFFGQISPYKGIPVLLEAAFILRQRGITDFSVTIHGNIANQSDIFQTEFAEKMQSLAGIVHYQGRYQPETLSTLMNDVDWVVMPSIWWENAPLVIAEARHHRRPVICSGIGGMAEFVQNDITGLHFRVGDAYHLADVMQRAMEMPSLWERLHHAITPPPSMQDCAMAHANIYPLRT